MLTSTNLKAWLSVKCKTVPQIAAKIKYMNVFKLGISQKNKTIMKLNKLINID